MKRKNKEIKTFVGIVQASDRGFAFIIPDDKEKFNKDFFVPRSSFNGAYNGDKVLAAHVYGTKDEAKIIKIIERGNTFVVGTFEKIGKSAKLYPDDRKLPKINIPLSLSGKANSGDKVLCEITSYPAKGLPHGKVLETLGKSGDFDAEELSIIRTYGLYETFPDNVIKEAETSAQKQIVPNGLLDLRDKLIFTIDGEDTRDIDDAVSLEMRDGKYILGVHIADVSRYVELKTELDNEAYARSTSVYFPDRVLPMLPKALSNGACSLNEGEDRYAVSCIMTFDENGNRIHGEIAESIINSRHKMTYPAVTAICAGDSYFCKKYNDIVNTVLDMQKLCIILENKRKAQGNIELEVNEPKIYVDGNGEIIIKSGERGISERMIEQFMISANEAVAEFLIKNNAPCLFRIHEIPSPEKAEMLMAFLKDLGIKCKFNCDNIAPQDFQDILKAIQDKPYASVVNKVMLRSMQKARYSHINAGHFGLASSAYCHFTSPIRRYPDLFVHRSVKAVLHGNNKALHKYSSFAKFAGDECSARERIADEAERSVDDLYKVVYMSDRIGEVFDATVSGVTNFGIL
nr:ribonuclease R [Clostridia bacterium]